MASAGIENLLARADRGEIGAQYDAAAALGAAGRKSEADLLLHAAAEAGDPRALYTLAARSMQSSAAVGEAMPMLARADLAGFGPARRLIAVLKAEGRGAPRDEAAAIGAVARLAQAGDPSAKREIAGLLLLTDPEDQDAARLIEEASPDDAVAAALCCARAIAERGTGAIEIARGALNLLAEAGYPRAGELARRLKDAPEFGRPARPVDWTGLLARLRLDPVADVEARLLCERPRIMMAKSAVPIEICEYLIAHAAYRLGPSLIVDSRDGTTKRHPSRTSLTASLGLADLDLALIGLNRLLASAAGCDAAKGESLSVLQYSPRQEYRPHYDCLPPGADRDRHGQRVTTALLYLNDDYSGGETHFLVPDMKIAGAAGDLMIFSNVLPDGEPDLSTRHAGLPVLEGHKWLASKWFRDRPLDF